MAKKAHKPILLLLDVHAIIHRAYHAMPDFTSTSGVPTGAIYGLATMLMKAIIDLKPEYVIACYDLPQKTFRHEAYKDYKAGRAKADDALVAQLVTSRRLFDALNIPMYDCPGFEADDMLGTIVSQVKTKKIDVDVIIASGDMDTLQLVDDAKVRVFTLKKGINDTIIYDEEAVLARFGFKPKLLVDYKGLRGDPSDNIIGIKGIGEKTATTLVTTFGSIENMYKALKKEDPRFKEIGITDRVKTLLKDNEEEALFSKTLATIRHDAPIDFTLPEPFRKNVDVKKTEDLFREYEFKSLIPRLKTIHDMESVDDPEEDMSSHDPVMIEELAIQMWLLNSELSNITATDIQYYGGSKSIDEAQVKIEQAITRDNLTYVYETIEKPLLPLVHEMQNNGIKVDCEYLKKLSDEYHVELTRYEKKIWDYAGREFNINSPKQLGEILFDEMNLHAKGLKKTAGGARSTRESELEKLREAHPIVEEIFRYRELQKLLSTYIDTIPKLVAEDGRLHSKFNQAGTTTGRFSSNDPNLQNIPIKSELGKRIRDAFVADKGSKLVSFDYSQIELRIAAMLSQDPYLLKVFQEKKDVHAAVASRVFGVPEDKVTPDMRRRAKVINFGILYGMGVSALKTNLGTDRAEAQEFYDSYFIQFPSIRGYLDGVIEEAKKKGYTETLCGRRRHFSAFKSKLPFMIAMAERMAINAPIQGTSADLIKLAIIQVEEYLKKHNLKDEVKLILQVHDELVYETKEDKVETVSKEIEKIMEDVLPLDRLGTLTPAPLEVHVATGEHWGELK